MVGIHSGGSGATSACSPWDGKLPIPGRIPNRMPAGSPKSGRESKGMPLYTRIRSERFGSGLLPTGMNEERTEFAR